MAYTVRAGSHSICIICEHARVHRWVMQKPQGIISNVEMLVKEAIIQAHAHSDCTHYLEVQTLAEVMEAQHVLLEPSHRSLLALRPLIRMLLLAFASDLVALLQIRRGVSLLCNIADVHLLRHLFFAGGRIPAIGLGSGPRDVHLGFVRLAEEVGRHRERVLDHVERDRVVLEVDEAGILEAV